MHGCRIPGLAERNEGKMRSPLTAVVCGAGVAVILLAACRRSESPSAVTPASRPTPKTDQHPPFGSIDTPKENDTVASGSRALGWALDDSGVARVDGSLDNGPATPAELGQAFSGVKEAYPNYPNSDRPGFAFAMPSAPAGPHLLVVTITAKDGGKTDLKRHIQIK